MLLDIKTLEKYNITSPKLSTITKMRHFIFKNFRNQKSFKILYNNFETKLSFVKQRKKKKKETKTIPSIFFSALICFLNTKYRFIEYDNFSNNHFHNFHANQVSSSDSLN